MIIFDLDGTLANCEHRRHLVDPEKNPDYECVYLENAHTRNWKGSYRPGFAELSDMPMGDRVHRDKITKKLWQPDWPAFHTACDKDLPIEQVISIWNDQISLGMMENHAIWSDRCESARDQTEKWLDKHLLCFEPHQLKMRPIGNTEPAHVLKERWLDESSQIVDMAFESDPNSIAMYRRRGIFVFDCRQDS